MSTVTKKATENIITKMKNVRELALDLWEQNGINFYIEFCEAVDCDVYDGYAGCVVNSQYILYSKNEEHNQLEVAEVVGTNLETGEEEVLAYLWSELSEGQILTQDGGENEDELVKVIKEFMSR